jgi:hypothetical protein
MKPSVNSTIVWPSLAMQNRRRCVTPQRLFAIASFKDHLYSLVYSEQLNIRIPNLKQADPFSRPPDCRVNTSESLVNFDQIYRFFCCPLHTRQALRLIGLIKEQRVSQASKVGNDSELHLEGSRSPRPECPTQNGPILKGRNRDGRRTCALLLTQLTRLLQRELTSHSMNSLTQVDTPVCCMT